MRIAVICPSPDPFQFGGMERLALNLTKAINDHSPYSAELLKIPFKEETFFQVIKGYCKFWKLKVENFDAVISLKYPAWMINHHHHILYMTHKLRGLYDTYQGRLSCLAYFIENPFKFPGIYIRKIIHLLDNYAMKPDKIVQCFAISREVSSRANYFPKGIEADILFPPTDLCLQGDEKSKYKHIFSAGRLDAPKRVDIIIKSMRYVSGDVKLFIAGEGLERKKLRDLALSDSRIIFLGHISNEVMKNYLEDALVVPFVPHKEDFGLVALEAMKFKKPVITFTDSGGSTELVKNEETGFIVDPSPQSLAEKINFFIENPDKAEEFGKAAFESVKHINMKNTALKLLESLRWKEDMETLTKCSKRKILLLSTYPIYPPYGGGKARIYYLYKELSRYFRVIVVVLSQTDDSYDLRKHTDDFFEVLVPMSKLHKKFLWEYEKDVGVPLSDVTAPELVRYTPLFEKVVNGYVNEVDIVIVSHPYLFPLIEAYKHKPLIYESHNVEFSLKKDLFSKTRLGRKLLKSVFRVERAALKTSKMVFVTSFEEAVELDKIYRTGQGKMATIPNGVNIAERAEGGYDRDAITSKHGISEKRIVLFMGAWHPPNLEALLFIKDELCPFFPDVKFLVIGSVWDQYKSIYQNENLPENLVLFGNLSEDEKFELFSITDIAINPMRSGSGTNLKMLDFMASGVPVLSTPVGARGLDLKAGEHYFQAELKSFRQKLEELLAKGEERQAVALNGKKLVRERYDFKIIADKAARIISELLPSKRQEKLSVDLSKNDYFGVGWYPPELWEGNEVVRWTDGHGVVSVEGKGNFSRVLLTLQPGSYDAPVVIYLNGEKSFEKTLSKGWNEIKIDVRKAAEERMIVNITSPTWSPHLSAQSPDSRMLGVAVKKITFDVDKSP